MSYTKGTWHTGDQIRDHKLACSIINLYGTEDEVFDPLQLDLLKRFVDDVSMQNRDQILEENGWADVPGTRHGDQAVKKDGSLAGFMIARYGTDDPALDDRDWELLRQWFGKGMPKGEHVQR